jgi:hypothetical protein
VLLAGSLLRLIAFFQDMQNNYVAHCMSQPGVGCCLFLGVGLAGSQRRCALDAPHARCVWWRAEAKLAHGLGLQVVFRGGWVSMP